MTMAYGGVIACWFIFLACTLHLAPIFHEGPYRLISTPAYLAFTGANVALSLWLLQGFLRARQAQSGLRRGQVAGIACSLIFLAVLQSGAQALHHNLNEEDRTDPARIAAFISSQNEDVQAALSVVCDSIRVAHPGLREALWNDVLVYQHEGSFSHGLQVLPDELLLRIYQWPGALHSIDDGPWALEVAPDIPGAALRIQLPLSSADLVRLRTIVTTLPRGE